jgi:8-oxo-dGTP pyrophosphatase MutT (NUDIX family)
MSSRPYNFCNNCGETGHAFHQCKHPITSIGVIVFRKSKATNKYEYLMICRKDSLGYVDFMRGKYPVYNKDYLTNIFNEMTNAEKKKVVTGEFKTLWSELWGDSIGIQYRGEERVSRERFHLLKEGVESDSHKYNLESLTESSITNWNEPEWGFPKGRRNYQEKDISCALREFEEETGYSSKLLKVMQNVIPFEEIFTGSNYKSYKHCYYVAYMDDEIDVPSSYQETEVSKVEWFPFDIAMEKIRPYNLEKKEVLNKVNKLLNTYRICS